MSSDYRDILVTFCLQAYGRDLAEAHDWCKKYRSTNSIKDLNQAWDLYYHVFRKISKQLPQVRLSETTHLVCRKPPFSLQLTTLELQYVSPKLLACRDLELAVPGTYDPNSVTIRINRVASALHVITSKQRPRKLRIYGNYCPVQSFAGDSTQCTILQVVTVKSTCSCSKAMRTSDKMSVSCSSLDWSTPYWPVTQRLLTDIYS